MIIEAEREPTREELLDAALAFNELAQGCAKHCRDATRLKELLAQAYEIAGQGRA